MGTRPPPLPRWHFVRSASSVTAAIAALGLLFVWMGGSAREKVRAGEVLPPRSSAHGRTIVAVERIRSQETTSSVGSVQPKRQTVLASQQLATVLDVRVRPGDRVKPGDLLVTLDDRELAAQHREATAALAAAEADLVTRLSDYNRVKRLREKGSVSSEEYSKVEGSLRVSEAQVTRAKEVIARLAVQLSHTRIVALVMGVVADRFVDPGDLAVPGKPILSVYDPTNLELHVDIPEALAPAVPVGKELAVRIDSAAVTTKGTVREVVPQARPASRSVLVKVSLPSVNLDRRLLPGMYGRVDVPVGSADRLWVPRYAVRRVGQLDLAQVANPDGTLTRRFVRVGVEVGDKIEILSGLAAGERVVLSAEVSR